MVSKNECLELLNISLNCSNANFRENQWEAIESLTVKRKKILVIERTGWGKSTVYFLATKILRRQGFGLTLIISPLLALMRNQIYSAERLQTKADSINSSNTEDWPNIKNKVLRGEIDVLLISPERLANDDFVNEIIMPISNKIGMFVIDEAHCISDWGHDFRPDYKRINNILKLMPETVPVLATTATANDRVVEDIKTQIGDQLIIQRGTLLRKSIFLQCINMPLQSERLAWLVKHLPTLPGSGVIYVLTKRDAINVSNWLQKNSISALPYFGGIENKNFKNSSEYRLYLENKLFNNGIKVLVATTALGMGYDKPDLGFVVHYQAPGSIIAYYQQVGRAGRAIKKSHGILLHGQEDNEIHEYFISNSFPEESWVSKILSKLNEIGEVSVIELEKLINMKRSQIDKTLKYLSVRPSPPVIKINGKWNRTANSYFHDIDYINRIKNQKFYEWEEVNKYINHPKCRMSFLAKVLDDPFPKVCGKCDVCLKKQLIPNTIDQELIIEANKHLKRSELTLISKKQIPRGALPIYGFSGNLEIKLRASEGRVLSRWNDSGWGKIVANDKMNNYFSDELIFAVKEMFLERWKPHPSPEWITSVPSLNNVFLVQNFAERLSIALEIPYINSIKKIKKNDYQKKQENTFFQFNNLDGVFEINKVNKAPVLLVDDIVDSSATITILSALLLNEGVKAVFPLALASTNFGN